MIPDSTGAAIDHPFLLRDWKQSLATAIRDPQELLSLLELDNRADLLDAAQQAAQRFPLRVPMAYIKRMRRGDIHDPLLRQVLPLADELDRVTGFTSDAVGDLQAMTQPGLIQKYHGRVLLVVTGACAVHCRYCFRREFPYSQADPKFDQWQTSLEQIARDTEISEVILSGGDPLTLTDRSLDKLIRRLAEIPHLRRLRIHSRLPVVLPERITPKLCEIFYRTRLQVIHVIHSNHAQEIDDSVQEAVSHLRRNGDLIFNQAVLLKGVNDSVRALLDLSERLVAVGVHPYYLHLLDRVSGAHHFEVIESRAKLLVQQIRRKAPGYMVPQLVREIVGECAKLPVALDL